MNRSRPGRLSIHLQLLIPMVLLVLITSIGATSVTAIWIARGIQRQQSVELERIIHTLTHSSFPLTRSVLTQISGLSNADFVLLDAQTRVVESTLEGETFEPSHLVQAAEDRVPAKLAGGAGDADKREYVVDQIRIAPRGPSTEPQTLLILRPTESLSQRLNEAIYPAITVGVVALLIASTIAGWIARRLVAPIQRIAEHAAVIARGEFQPVGLPERGDELGDLAQSIDAMAAQLDEYSEKVRQIERIETLSKIGAAMAHQLRNSATGGRIAVELHMRDCPLSDDETLSVALRQFQLMESHLRQYLAVDSKSAAHRVCDIDLVELVRSTVALLEPMASHAKIAWSVQLPEAPLWVKVDGSEIEQLLMNLLMNAIEAVSASSRTPRRISIRLTEDSSGQGRLEIQDSGDGLAPEVLSDMFHPFNTNKPDGVGLGLFVAHLIARRHHGTLSYERIGDVTCFSFRFPLGVVAGENGSYRR